MPSASRRDKVLFIRLYVIDAVPNRYFVKTIRLFNVLERLV